MARTLIVKLTCDRCEAEGDGDEVDGAQSVTFAYDGYSYGLDLCARHADEFHGTVQGMISIASTRDRVGAGARRARSTITPAGPPTSATTRPARRDKEQLQAIREWANGNGFKVSNRGRIPAEVEAAFHESFRRSDPS